PHEISQIVQDVNSYLSLVSQCVAEVPSVEATGVIGDWEFGIGDREDSFPVPHAPCPMLHAPCPISNALLFDSQVIMEK
ncbi:MAG: hypothetical protein ACYTXY_23680, partial [Nostoc sp.]